MYHLISNQNLVEGWKEQRPNDICLLEDAIKVDYIKLCKDNDLPNYIDYLQLDIDPASNTFKVLKKSHLMILEFGVITYEHDFYMMKMKNGEQNLENYY